MDAKAARTTNIRDLVKRTGGPADFAAATGNRWVAAQVSQWISRTNPKPLGHKLAREIETVMGIPNGWLDQAHSLNELTEKNSLNTSFTPHVSQDVRYSPEIVAVAWNWVRFEEGPIDKKGRQLYAYPSDLDRAKRLLELCALIQADGGTLTPQHSEELITAARARQQQGKGKHGKRSNNGRASTG